MIRGDVKGKAPVAAAPLTPEQRAKLKLDPQGITAFYPAQDEGVFFDVAGSALVVWFSGGDTDRATISLDGALKRAFPQTQQLDDVPHPRDSRMRARAYRVELGQGRLAAISTSFADLPDGRHTFTVRVLAQQRPS